MKRVFISSIIGAIILYLTGCTSVKFYSNSELTEPTGIKYYTVKPYLLVEKDPVNNSIVKVTVLYLPDLEKPQYMVIKDGLGSKKADLKLSDGSISTFGLTTDSNFAESIEALTGLISGGASTLADLSALKNVPHAAAPSNLTELYEVLMSDGITTVKKIEIK